MRFFVLWVGTSGAIFCALAGAFRDVISPLRPKRSWVGTSGAIFCALAGAFRDVNSSTTAETLLGRDLWCDFLCSGSGPLVRFFVLSLVLFVM